MPDVAALDTLGRAPVSDAMKRRIDEALRTIPEGKRGALLILADEHGARLHVAAKFSDGWHVAGGVGKTWRGGVDGWVGIEGKW